MVGVPVVNGFVAGGVVVVVPAGEAAVEHAVRESRIAATKIAANFLISISLASPYITSPYTPVFSFPGRTLSPRCGRWWYAAGNKCRLPGAAPAPASCPCL